MWHGALAALLTLGPAQRVQAEQCRFQSQHEQGNTLCVQIQNLTAETSKYLWVGQPRGRAVGHQAPFPRPSHPALSAGANLFSSSPSQTSEEGRSVLAKALFPAQSVAQTGREFTVRKCLAFPAATRKETTSCSNPQNSILLKPHFWAALPSWYPEMPGKNQAVRPSVFLTPVSHLSRAGAELLLLLPVV